MEDQRDRGRANHDGREPGGGKPAPRRERCHVGGMRGDQERGRDDERQCGRPPPGVELANAPEEDLRQQPDEGEIQQYQHKRGLGHGAPSQSFSTACSEIAAVAAGIGPALRRGNHQFPLPMSFMAAGTTTIRITLTSRATPAARPKPSCWIGMMPVKANAPNTAIIASAAPEISGAVQASPVAMLAVL